MVAGHERERPAPTAPGMVLAIALFALYVGWRAWVHESYALLALTPALLHPRTRRGAAVLALLHHLVPGTLPLSLGATGRLLRAPFAAANHEWLEAWVLLLLALLPGRDALERMSLRRAWIAILGLLVLASGVQKVAHGAYVRGDYFVVEAVVPDKFSRAITPLLAEEERAKVAAFIREFSWFIDAARPGVLEAEPPRPALVVGLSRFACWSTLAAELLLPPLLLWPRRRRWTSVAIIAFFLGVEAVASEWVFGALVGVLLVPSLAEPSRDGPGGRDDLRSLPRPAQALLCAFALWPLAHIALSHGTGLTSWKLGGWGMYATNAAWGKAVLEGRAPGSSTYLPLKPRDAREEKRVKHAGFILRQAPFARGPARELVRERAAEAVMGGAPGTSYRLRATVVRFDRTRGRFIAEERVVTSEE